MHWVSDESIHSRSVAASQGRLARLCSGSSASFSGVGCAVIIIATQFHRFTIYSIGCNLYVLGTTWSLLNVVRMSNKRCVNANVSSTPLSSEEREKIQCLHVVPEKRSHGNFSAGVWKYFGQLVFRTPNTCIGDNDDNNPSSLTSSQSTSTKETVIDQNSRYCGVCLDREIRLWQLHKLARFYLSISATSVPVEAMFSITGIMLNSKRSSTSPTVLNYCTFIHDNHSVLQTTWLNWLFG